MGIFFEGRIFFLYPYGTILNLQLLTGHVPDNILTIKNTSKKIIRRNIIVQVSKDISRGKVKKKTVVKLGNLEFSVS